MVAFLILAQIVAAAMKHGWLPSLVGMGFVLLTGFLILWGFSDE